MTGPRSAQPSAERLLESVAQRLRARRTELGLTQAAVAKRAGVSSRFLIQVETGHANISLARLHEVCAALHLSMADLFAGLDADAAKAPKVALVGLRGAGKSTLGPLVARSLDVPFIELDQRIEDAAGMRLAELFELRGEAHYRSLEEQVLQGLLDRDDGFVLATGGSLVTSVRAWDALRRGATTVWLKATPETHLERVRGQGDLRPMRGRPDALRELRAILRERQPLYALADRTVDTNHGSAEDCARMCTPAPTRPNG